jgi:VCBS repeat-containing protein
MPNPLSWFLTTRSARARRPKLQIGQLEDRTVPALSVVSATPAPEWVAVPLTTVDLTFNNPVSPASVQPADLTLRRNGSAIGTVTGAQVVPGSGDRTVRFSVTGLTTPGQLTTLVQPGAVTAANGELNEPYSADYTLTSVGLSAVRPLGGLVYRGSVTGAYPNTGPFTFAAQAGQTITLVASPNPGNGSVPTVTLFGPAGVTGAGPQLGQATSPGIGAAAVLQTIPVPTTGLYTAFVSGPPVEPVNPFTLTVLINAAQEVEGTGAGVTNNTPATAQDLGGAFAALTPEAGAADRAAVAGQFTGSPDHYAIPLAAGQTIGVGLGQANPSDRLFGSPSVTRQSPPVGSAPTDVAVGDLNGDGLGDFVYSLFNASGGGGGVLVHYGTGGLLFQGAVIPSGGLSPQAVRLADLNGDGKLDAVVANEASGTVGVLFGTGANPFGGEGPPPSFSGPTVYAAGPSPRAMALGDLNNDGKADIVVGNGSGNSLNVLLNNGNGTFAAAVPISLAGSGNPGAIINGVAIGDVTGDGQPDIAAVTVDNAALTILPGTGAGTFGAPVSDLTGGANPQDVVLADLNGDGRLDAAALNRVSSLAASVSVFLNQNNPADPFGSPTLFAAGASSTSGPRYRLAAADFDLDGRLDLAASTADPGVIDVLLGNGAGAIDQRLAVPLVSPGSALPGRPGGFSVADWNGDGTPDLAVANTELVTNGNTISTVANGMSRLRVDVVDAAGTVLAAGAPAANLASAIPAFTAPAAGTYYLRVSGLGRSDYAAVVTRGAAFDTEPNGTQATAQSLDGAGGAVGHVGRTGRLFAAIHSGPAQIQELDPVTGAVVRSFPPPNTSSFTTGDNIGLAFDGNSLFYLRFAGSPPTLFELDPDTGAVRDADIVPVSSNLIDGLAALNGKVYLSDAGNNRIHVFDPVTDTIVSTLLVNADLHGGLAGITAPDRLVATTSVTGAATRVVEIDPATGRITSSFFTGANGGTPIPNFAARGLAVADGELHIARLDSGLRTDVYTRGGQYLRTVVSPILVLALGGDDLGQSPVDWYAVPAAAGDDIILSTRTPGDVSGAVGNTLDPRLELFDPSGALVATGVAGPDGRNETIAYTAQAGGTYRVRVTGQNNTRGEYFLTSAVAASGRPDAVNDAAETAEDTAATVEVLANDTDPNGDPLTVTAVTQGAHGSVVINPDGTVTYTPAANFNGLDSFTYTATDTTGLSDTATVTVTVTPVNDAPVAVDDAYTTPEDTPLDVAAPGVLVNDSDPDGDPLTLTLLEPPAVGSAFLHPDGRLVYDPPEEFSGTVTFTYEINDAVAASVATVTVTVTAVNDPPVAGTDFATLAEDTSALIAVLANDTDVEGDPLTVTDVETPSHGTAVLNEDGTVTYTPFANYFGLDFFNYSISDGNGGTASASVALTVTPVSDPPVGVPDSYSTDEDVELIVAAPGVLGNDSDPDGDELAAEFVSEPAHGMLVLATDGFFRYQPTGDYHGPDSFQYRVYDGQTATAPITVSITVQSVNDRPIAAGDAYDVDEGDTLSIAAPGVLWNDFDFDNDPLTAVLGAGPAHGTLTLNADGSFTYTPNTNYSGPDSFTYRASDGAATSDPATVSITVRNINDPPVAVADTYTVDEDQTLSVALPGVLGNDTDPDGDPLTTRLISGPAHGSLTLNADGSFSYTPAANYNGSDAFVYRAQDATTESADATVSITVHSVNDVPVAGDDTASTPEDSPVTVAVLANDADPDGDPLTITAVTPGAHGSVAVNPDGTVTYTPAANFNGSDSFTYTVSDGNGGTDTAAVAVVVTPVNDLPVVSPESYTVAEDQTLTVPAPGVLGNDTDPDGDPLTAAVANGPSHGSLTLNANGSFVYTPAANYSGPDSFTYRASDGQGGSATAVVSLTVTPVNDPPVAAGDSYSVAEDATPTVPAAGVLANDTDPDGDPLSAILAAGPAHGSLTLNADGSFTYTPAANYFGPDSFSYRADDGTVTGNVATVALTVLPVNDAPAFTAGASQTVLEDAGPQTVAGWATGLSAGPANEAGQALSFEVVGNTNPGLFAAGPAVSPAGTLTYTPAPDASGTATIQVRARDDGGTANGGVDVSPTRTFTITVTPRPDVASVVVNKGAIQRSMVTEVQVTFDTTVTLDAGAFTMTRTGGGTVQTITVSTAVVNGRTVATLTFSRNGTSHGSLIDGLWTLRVVASKVRATTGGLAMAADHTFGLHRLFGDSNGDRRVDAVDEAAFNAAYGTRVGHPGYLAYFDFDANGAIERKDRDQFRARLGQSL